MAFSGSIVRVIRRFYWPLCLFNRHVPDRRKARWDGLNYVSTCRLCDRAIRRRTHGGWVREWMDSEPPAD